MHPAFEALESRKLWCTVATSPGAEGMASAPAASAALFSQGTIDSGPEAFIGYWQSGPALPTSLAEVAAGAIGGKIYVVGELNPATFIFDVASGTWSTGAARPHPGNHHAAEVYNGRLYLFGGLTAGSDGKVQIYDPVTDAWTKGADMPFAAGSGASALIGGKVYVAGGIIGSSTTNRVSRYDPDADAWAELAPMPQGRNHTATTTDGLKLYVFGGRGPGSGDRNVTTNGFDTFQLYDPATNMWESSETPGSPLPPLPQARGGMGKAVRLGDYLYVFGGETLTGPGATADGVYDRVDVYSLSTNSWFTDAAMPTARHGIFPIEVDRRIYVAAGGVRFGGSASAVLEIFDPALTRLPPSPPSPPSPAPPAVVGRWVFYNNSAFDGNDPAASAADDGAIATDKAASPPGLQTSFANYTSYSKGINGIMVDIARLPTATAPTAADFAFETGNTYPFTQPWTTTAPTPASVTLRRGAGVAGSDRITLVWPDGQIQKTWLRVRVAATANTGLSQEDVFYFGNWPGETGNKPRVKRLNGIVVHAAPVDKTDVARTARNRTRRRNPAPVLVTSTFDFNRDGVVNVLDRRIAAQNRSSRTAFLVLV